MKKIIIIVSAVVLVLVIVAVALFFLVFNKPKEEPVHEVLNYEFELGEMYSNIFEPGRILRTKAVIEYSDEAFIAKLEKNKSRIINDITQLYRKTKLEEINAPNGQERLREAILDMVREITEADQETVTDVLFLDFIVQ